ncbi:DUF4245 domain-containing protein [Streptomyces sp. NBC_01794]|nr:DUF4245 domain-containing protein [Streptomyces sp. NBC_01750]WSB00560.1 DUF4245 domain-containing protein [Streptomyces sp. NBC_01794]WSD35083.1 DUF4245 domain-containing protein [Streptomyces sp. NBC_01750]
MAGMRGRQTVRDMVLSMAVIGAVVAVIYMFIPHDDKADPVKAVDYRVELLTARRAAPYPVAAPEGLAKEWKPTSVSYERAGADAWHLGFLDPDGEYIAVEQSTAPAGKYIAKVSQQARETGKTQQVGGVAWRLWEGPKYDALVREDKGSTTVITGTASPERLAELAAALETKKS